MKQMIIASTSTVHGSHFLEYILDDLKALYKNTDEVLFIPYARPGGVSHDQYTSKAAEAFNKIDKKLIGLHTYSEVEKAVESAKGIFTGGGNTFVLLNNLYRFNLIEPLQAAIKNGVPYLGTSAGSNICGLSINTTNDMPIVYPPSFKALSLVPFNINPHYLDPIANSTHMGETRETRIQEFHHFNTQPVIGLREGSWLSVIGDDIVLKGELKARIFEYGKDPYELSPNTVINDLR